MSGGGLKTFLGNIKSQDPTLHFKFISPVTDFIDKSFLGGT